MIFWESDLNFVTVLLDAINLGHLLLQKPNGAGDRRVHAATIHTRAVLRRDRDKTVASSFVNRGNSVIFSYSAYPHMEKPARQPSPSLAIVRGIFFTCYIGFLTQPVINFARVFFIAF